MTLGLRWKQWSTVTARYLYLPSDVVEEQIMAFPQEARSACGKVNREDVFRP
jgi:hypothetical protein